MSEVITSVITKAAKIKMVKARAGIISMTSITGFIFGDGGINADGTIITPSQESTSLNNELLRKAIDGYEVITETCYRYKCTLTKSELVGKKITELALYDSENDLILIKNFAIKEKDGDMEMIFEVDDQF